MKFEAQSATRKEVYCGVALFVAETRLANGIVIEQNLDRNELLWGEFRQ